METKYCPNCRQNVTIGAEAKTNSGCVPALLLVILGLLIPLWFITLPVCWGLAFIIWICGCRPAPNRCPICKTPTERLLPPVPAT